MQAFSNYGLENIKGKLVRQFSDQVCIQVSLQVRNQVWDQILCLTINNFNYIEDQIDDHINGVS